MTLTTPTCYQAHSSHGSWPMAAMQTEKASLPDGGPETISNLIGRQNERNDPPNASQDLSHAAFTL